MSIDPPNADDRVRSIGRIAFVHWHALDGLEVRAVSEALLQLRRTIAAPLLIVAQFGPDVTMLNASGHVEFLHYSPLVARACECQYAVLNGSGLARRLLRASLTGVAALMRIPAEIVEDAETAIVHACTRGGLPTESVLAEARARGIIAATGSSFADERASHETPLR